MNRARPKGARGVLHRPRLTLLDLLPPELRLLLASFLISACYDNTLPTSIVTATKKLLTVMLREGVPEPDNLAHYGGLSMFWDRPFAILRWGLPRNEVRLETDDFTSGATWERFKDGEKTDELIKTVADFVRREGPWFKLQTTLMELPQSSEVTTPVEYVLYRSSTGFERKLYVISVDDVPEEAWDPPRGDPKERVRTSWTAPDLERLSKPIYGDEGSTIVQGTGSRLPHTIVTH